MDLVWDEEVLSNKQMIAQVKYIILAGYGKAHDFFIVLTTTYAGHGLFLD